MVELNPNHPITQAVHTEWHKIVALMMHRLWYGTTEQVGS